MEHGFDNAALTLAIAMAVGVSAQVIARHARIPGIVLLLVAGMFLGPDFANVIRPRALGVGMSAVVGFAVAVILFEGGLNLNLKHLRAQAKPIRRFVTWGALVTAAGGMLAARLAMGWDWRISILFGTLVIVTGPTVITPLLRRIRVKHDIATVLEAEGIFIDAVGATIAVVALEVALAPSTQSFAEGVVSVGLRLGVGALLGLLCGALLALLLRWRHIIPEGLENVLGLSFAVALFFLSNALYEESGITATIVAGLVVGNVGSHALGGLVQFKEQLTVLLIATLFVLLAADVRVADVRALGLPGVVTVLALMFFVRPANVAVSTIGAGFGWRDKAFLAWLAPRGIVAAAVAALFARTLEAQGVRGGIQLQALVFLVIASTVFVQGLTGGLVARLLGVRRQENTGYLLLGANALGRALGEALKGSGQEVTFIDANPDACRVAEEAGFKVIYGNGLEEHTLARARANTRIACVAITPNEKVNLLFARHVHDDFPGTKVMVALETEASGVTEKMVLDLGATLLFGRARKLGKWRHQLRRQDSIVERWQCDNAGALSVRDDDYNSLLPIALTRGERVEFVTEKTVFKSGDVVAFALLSDRADDARARLQSAGWAKAE